MMLDVLPMLPFLSVLPMLSELSRCSLSSRDTLWAPDDSCAHWAAVAEYPWRQIFLRLLCGGRQDFPIFLSGVYIALGSGHLSSLGPGKKWWKTPK